MADLSRLREPSKVFTGTFSNIAADSLLNIFKDKGQSNVGLLDISNIDWERIVIDIDVTTLTGTNVIFKLKTANTKTGTAIAAATMDAKNGAGTNVASGTLTAAGRVLVSVARLEADAGASNIGALIGLYADTSSLTDLDGTVTIYVGK